MQAIYLIIGQTIGKIKMLKGITVIAGGSHLGGEPDISLMILVNVIYCVLGQTCLQGMILQCNFLSLKIA